jgi:uncharacterized protein (DUF2141 family)
MHSRNSLPPVRVPAAARFTVASLLLAAAAFGLVAPARAQEDNILARALVGFNKDVAPGTLGAILRPNVAQEVFVWAYNEDPDNEQKLTIQFLVGGKAELSKEVTVPKGGKMLVAWDKAPPAPKELKGAIRFRALNKDGKYNAGTDAKLDIAPPRGYMKATAGYDPGDQKKAGGRLDATAEPSLKQEADRKSAAKVELDLSRANLPALLPDLPKAGRYAGLLRLEKDASLTLEARGLKFADEGEGDGPVYLNADGWARAFVFRLTYGVSGAERTVDPVTTPMLSLSLPRYSKPGQVAASVRADGEIDWGHKILVQTVAGKKKAKAAEGEGDKKGDDKKDKGDDRLWATVAEFAGPRAVKTTYKAGDNGGLEITPTVSEHKASLDFTGVFEEAQVRLVLVTGKDENGEDVLSERLYDGNTLKPAPRVKYEVRLPKKKGEEEKKETREGTAVFQSIMFDETPPDVLEFEGAERVALRGQKLALFVKAGDKESGIADVSFYLGKPEGDKMPPALKPIRAELKDKGRGLWGAAIDVPADAKGPLVVTAVATNGVGLTRAKTESIPVEDAKATITGRVFETDTALEGVPVVLMSAEEKDRGRELRVERAGAGGKFTFAGLEPGKYALFARREMNGSRKLSGVIEIVGRETVDRDLNLEPPEDVLKAKEKRKEKAKKARISGQVVEGPRAQPGVRMRLFDLTARKEVATAVTDGDGRYQFKDLEKGRYAVTALKSASNTRSRTEVDLADGEDKKGVDLKLYRR